jgi:hypothetical protein
VSGRGSIFPNASTPPSATAETSSAQQCSGSSRSLVCVPLLRRFGSAVSSFSHVGRFCASRPSATISAVPFPRVVLSRVLFARPHRLDRKQARIKPTQPRCPVQSTIRHQTLSTRPSPIDGSFAQSPTNWVGMDVLDRRGDGRRTHQISVIAGTLLPKPKGCDAGSLPNGEALEGRIPRDDEVAFDTPRQLTFEIPQKVGNSRLRSTGVHKQMHMLGHQDVGQKQEFVSVAGTLENLAQPSAPQVVGEKGLPLNAGERQLVNMSLTFEVLDSFSMRLVHAHNVAKRIVTR